VPHNGSCLVTFNDAQLTWFQAAYECSKLNGSLASFDTAGSASVDFFTAAQISPRCSWLGLIKPYFFWTIIERK